MAAIVGFGTALPAHYVSVEETKRALGRAYAPRIATRFARLVDSSGIRGRYVAVPVDELLARTSIEDRDRAYAEHALGLARTAVQRALADAGTAAADCEAIVCVSCTGYMLPSLESHLAVEMGIDPHARRVPIGGLGCSAGVAALALGAQLVRPASRRAVLVVSVEICSLCLQTEEPSVDDVLGSILFADGAAAAVVADGPALVEVRAARSVLWPGTSDKLGMRLSRSGFRLVLSNEIARLLRPRIGPWVESFLAESGVRFADLEFFVVHPGGPRILQAIGEGLALDARHLAPSAAVLDELGNLSSATVFAILERIRKRPPRPGSLGLMLAVGPGLTCELVLLRWGEAA